MMCVRLSAMQEQARLREFCAQNSLSAPTQVFVECGVRSTENENLARMRDFGFELIQNIPPPAMKIWLGLRTFHPLLLTPYSQNKNWVRT